MVEGQCDGIDINFGCPQKVAKRGNYGAFLMDDWEKLVSIVWTLSHGGLSVPVTLKVQTYTLRHKGDEHATESEYCYLIVSLRLRFSILFPKNAHFPLTTQMRVYESVHETIAVCRMLVQVHPCRTNFSHAFARPLTPHFEVVWRRFVYTSAQSLSGRHVTDLPAPATTTPEGGGSGRLEPNQKGHDLDPEPSFSPSCTHIELTPFCRLRQR